MKAIDVIRNTLAVSEAATMRLIEDMRDAALTAPTPRGGNHPLWVLGHIAFIEGGVPRILFGEPHALEKWAVLFAPGAEPLMDAKAYPPFEEILRTYRDLRARNLQILEKLGDGGLELVPKSPLPGLEDRMKTAADVFLLAALHQMNHRGQVADARRAAGRKPMFTPGR